MNDVSEGVCWPKMEALVKGTALASKKLWRN
jgi:hypothetical protein